MDKIGFTSKILSVITELSFSQEQEILQHYFASILEVMKCGNRNVQKSIYDYFNTVQTSEKIFEFFNIIISQEIEFIYFEQQKVKQDNRKKNNNFLYNILKFVQSACEGHYNDLQNYFRQQKIGKNNYNIVAQIVELLYAYTSNLNKIDFVMIVECLETLRLLVEGPCQDNQGVLIDGKFLNIAGNILSINFDGKKKSEKEKIDNPIFLEQWMIEKLKHQV